MPEQQRGHVEEGPMLGKKFVAFLISEMTWKVLAGLVLFWGRDSISDQVWLILLSIIVVAGFVEVGYIVGQASLDKYVRLAKIAADAGQSITLGKTVSTTTAPEKEKTPGRVV
jgi:hypothetical protein